MGRAVSRPEDTFQTKPVAPPDAQKNSDITKAEIEAKLTGIISSHSHSTSSSGSIITVTTTYQITESDVVVVCNSTTPFTVTLPEYSLNKEIEISNINTGAVTIEGSGSDTIDNELNQSISQWEVITVRCYAANKWIIT